MPALRAYQPFQLPDLPCPCLALALLTGFRQKAEGRGQRAEGRGQKTGRQVKEEGERAKEKKTARVKKRFDILKEQSKMAVLTSASDERKA